MTHHNDEEGAGGTNDNNDKFNFTRLSVPDTPNEHLVTAVPLMDPKAVFDTEHWAGHLPVDETGSAGLFYWLFAPDQSHVEDPDKLRNDPDIPLVIWLQGGPGCSSMDGLFLENGPFRFVPETGKRKSKKNSHKIIPAAYSWHKAPAYVMYVDQPVGTGLSYSLTGEVDRRDEQVNEHFYYFLQSFFKLHGDKMLVKEKRGVPTGYRPVYIAGESYAGHFIPNFITTILDRNDRIEPQDGKIKIPVAGAAIGNGWIDPKVQYSAAEVGYSHGLIGYAQMRALQDKERACQEKLESGSQSSQRTEQQCRDMLDDVIDNSHGKDIAIRVNMYNVRYEERSDVLRRDFPPGHKTVEQVLGGWSHGAAAGGAYFEDWITDAFVRALHAERTYQADQYYVECNVKPFEGIMESSGDDGDGQQPRVDVVKEIVDILHHPAKVHILFYNGVDDLVINHIGNDRALENLPWKLQDRWMKVVRHAWKSEHDHEYQVSGYMKAFANLHYLKILRAGHMVPMEVPGIAFDMIRTFVYGEKFHSQPQNLGRVNKPRECPICPENIES